MPLSRPTLAELVREKEADYDSRLPGADARLPASNLNVMARVDAGGEHGLYGYIDYKHRQTLPMVDHAEAEYLEDWAGVWTIRRLPPTFAYRLAEFTGNDGALVPEGTELQRGDGAFYVTTAAGVISGGKARIEVRAVEPGAAGTLAEGVKLRLTGTVAGVNGTAVVVADGALDGTDAESDVSLLSRLLTRINKPPHGGAEHDYMEWMSQVPGVARRDDGTPRAWPKPGWFGKGTVGIMFVTDGTGAGVIPGAELVATAQAHIDANRPVTAEAEVFAPTGKPLVVEIADLTPADDAVKARIVAALEDLLRREAAPGGTILISHIRAAISGALGETDHTLVSPLANVAHAAHEFPVLLVVWS